MYVCICMAVTERQICEAIERGVCTRKEINACLEAGTRCGKCNPEIRDLLRRNRPHNERAFDVAAALEIPGFGGVLAGAAQEACA